MNKGGQDEGRPVSANVDIEDLVRNSPPVGQAEQNVLAPNEETAVQDENMPCTDEEAGVEGASAEAENAEQDEDEVFSAYLAPTPEENRRRILENAVSAIHVRPYPTRPDPTSEEKWKKNLIILVIGVVVAAAISISLGIPLSRRNKDTSSVSSTGSFPTMTPTSAPTTTRFVEVISLVESLFNTTVQEDPSSPQYQAAHWIADEDTMFDDLGTVDQNHFRQRYALSVLYFATGGPTSWTETSFFLKSGVHECEWRQAAPEGTANISEFIGVNFCSSEKLVQYIELHQNNLTGTLPPEIGSFPALLGLSLIANNIGGTLPPSLFDLPNILYLSLWSNDFTGAIPKEIGKATTLRLTLSLADNYLTGTVPSTIGNLTSLEVLALNENMLTGTLSTALLRLPNLTYSFLYQNALSGTLPQSLWSSWPRLRAFAAMNNQFSGSIPNNLDTLSHLERLALEFNCFDGPFPSSIVALTNLTDFSVLSNKLTGSLPSDWGNLSQIESLWVFNNSLTGELPESLGGLSTLDGLNLAFNSFKGTIPKSFGNLTGLSSLYLNANQLTGTVPKSFARLTRLQRLWLQGNELTGDLSFLCNGTNMLFPFMHHFSADCDEEVDCPCCNTCCNMYQCYDA